MEEKKKESNRRQKNKELQENGGKDFAKKEPEVELRFFNPLPGCSESEKKAWPAGEDLLEGD